MKRKILLILGLIGVNILTFAQYSSGSPIAVGAIGVSVKMETTPTIVRITLIGPSNSFLGLGFGNQGMANGADGFIYNSAASRDYTFSGVGVTPSADASQDWTVISNTVAGSTRTVVATRTLAGGSGDTPVPNAAGTMDVFVAHGDNTLGLSYHGAGNRDYATLGMNFDSSLATGEVDLNMEKKILLYPNPSKGIVYLNSAEKVKSIVLYDTSGRKILEPKIKNSQIDISKLNSGTYFIEIEKSDGVKVFEKILKQ
ncbi:T9SS type A sorting domain-containing protein [Chryseobacterium sp.]|uniref:T9SS type A sorting domain-containing protein n=1 Tax=Chryseobacterium sp. TaxID=1871047 RepID=UPI0011CC0DCC|nr:T9SS type A sorting domain-containing protein [Chryseobacterium sp.]TXF77337.1 T9SS type A sorting domain-containing protein [Chryseobacterium sp.]